MRIKKERQLFIALIIAVFLIFLSSAAGGIITFSLLRNGYVGSAVEPLKLSYTPSTTFSSEFQKSLQPSLVKIIRYRNLPASPSILDEAFIDDKIISYGFLVSSDGWVVTCYSSKSSFVVLTSEGETFLPEKIIRAPSLGLNFIKINGGNFKILPLDGERNIAFGDDVFVIKDKKVFKSNLAYFGYLDFAREDSFILSSEEPNKFIFLKDEFKNDFVGLPIFSKGGEAIGVISNEDSIVPINLMKIYLRNLWKNESLAIPFLGVKYFDLSIAPVKLGVTDMKKGAYLFKKNELNAIVKNSPAEKAGLKPGDIILSVMGDEINEEYNLAERILEHAPGEKINLEVLRNGERMELNIELGEKE